jgi:hypothetical protein
MILFCLPKVTGCAMVESDMQSIEMINEEVGHELCFLRNLHEETDR